MALVFAAIAPHGGLAVAEACTPDEMRIAHSTRAGMEELGRAFAATRPEVVIVATPHNVHISGAFAVVVAARVTGSLDGTPQPVELDVPGDVQLAWNLLETLIADGLPAVGVSFGSNDPSTAVAPMDWGVLIPLWFMGGRQKPHCRSWSWHRRETCRRPTTCEPERLSPPRLLLQAGASHLSPAPTTATPIAPTALMGITSTPGSTTTSLSTWSAATSWLGWSTSRSPLSRRRKPTAGGRC